MRRAEREITDREGMLEVLREAQVLHLAMHDGEGIYVLPLNFGYTWEEELVLYLHGALEGKKIELLRADGRVGFAVTLEGGLVEGATPCNTGFRYASLVGKARAQLLEDPRDKQAALVALVRSLTGREVEIPPEQAQKTAVIRLQVEEITGKGRK